MHAKVSLRIRTGRALAFALTLTSGFLVTAFASFATAQVSGPDWTTSAIVPPEGRANIFEVSEAEFTILNQRGRLHAQIYPVGVTGILPPFEPFRKLAEGTGHGPLTDYFENVFRREVGVKNFDSVMAYIGLQPYPQIQDSGVYALPYPSDVRPATRVGFGLIERDGAKGFTFSCAACHAGRLFGRTILGLTNRFPRANDFFVRMKPLLHSVDPKMFRLWTGATREETLLLKRTRESLDHVAARKPIQLGLDTSLAQVALSMNQRSEDAYATPNRKAELAPRADPFLDAHPADSKPAVWWNLKYKNRWLSDGSVTSGNPVFTNFIWNEIGRGTDLRKLETWLGSNTETVRELTTAAFASEAPRFTDFFPAESLNLASAKRGEVVFNQACARCHGHYEKGWSAEDSGAMSQLALLATTRVIPIKKTFVVDVGTDRNRYLGMKSLEQLNRLSISRVNKVVIEPQRGYVPPPLVGIWARWPYLHNNSVPSLCALLTRASSRPKVYYAGEANDRELDFDPVCNGYPMGAAVPPTWKTSEYRFDTSREGLSNAGHDEGIFLKDGREILGVQEKTDLLAFLQTL